jgi:hypothetical protein
MKKIPLGEALDVSEEKALTDRVNSDFMGKGLMGFALNWFGI